MGRPGRKRIISSPEEFDRLVDEYMAHCEETGEPVTQTGMAMWLGFASQQSIHDYGKRPEYAESVRWSKILVENAYEKRLCGPGNPTGAIFALKNQGWSDRQDLNHSSQDGTLPVLVVKREG